MRQATFIFFSFLFIIKLNAQAIEEDLVQYSANYQFVEGIYLNFDEFKNNKPSIIKDYKNEGSAIKVYNDSAKRYLPIDPLLIWGYSDGKNIYVSIENGFWKIVNIGQLSQFTAVVITKYQTIDTFGFPVERFAKSLSQLFIDFNTGDLKRLNKENLEEYLSQNSNLTTKLKKRLKNETGLIIALKAYNELYPIYFPRP